MALSSDSLKIKLEAEFKNSGFENITLNSALCEAIAKAVVKEIQENAEVSVSSGSSAGTYKVG